MPHTSPDHRPARLLIVDDQESNLQVLGSILGRLGYDILPATSGATALKRLAVRPADLILLDVLMPGMDGFEVCRRIRENPEWSELPIIFLSAADDKSLIVRALESGGVDYVTKPFSQAELISRVRTHLALKFARDRLRQLAEDKDELLGILAHDLKNHLGGILMTAEVLHQGVGRLDEPRLARATGNLLASSNQMLAFVKEFLANAAAERGQPQELGPVNLADQAAQAVQQYQEAAGRKGIQLRLELPPADCRAHAAEAPLRQVLDNLISNAVKFSPHGRTVTVTVAGEDDGVCCRVKDEGPGFTDEDRAHMFRRYRRLSARPTGGEPSTGLGLSIVQRLVADLRGELRCESQPGRGAEFVLRLPRARPAADALDLNPHPAPVPAATG